MPQLMVSFRGETPPRWVLQGIERGSVAAVCLFAYNVSSPGQLRGLTAALHQAAKAGGHPPPLLGIDQEGGQLMAVTGGATELPGNMALGAAGSPRLAEAAGRVLGRELLAMGCNLDFAPVLDLSHNPGSPVVGLRSFGDDPRRVGELGAALIRGLQSTGVVATAKHFPGHGATGLDSHHQLPEIARSRAELEQVELAPFRAAIGAGVGAVMSAHVRYPALDEAPATLSRRILGELLRGELGFEGLVVTDAMDMAALAHLGPLERCRAALEAGADLVLLGHLEGQAELLQELAPAFRQPSLRRIAQARRALPRELPPLEAVGAVEHRQLAQEIADAAVTVVRGGGQLPLRLAPAARLAVITVEAGDLTPADTSSRVRVRLAEQIARRHPNSTALALPYLAPPEALAAVLAASREAEAVIVGTVNATHDPAQVALLRALCERRQRVVLVALRAPTDASAAPFVSTCLCAYGQREPNTESAARVLFGETRARGALPCLLAGPEVHDAAP